MAPLVDIPLGEVIVSDPRPAIIPALLAELDRALSQPASPWRRYAQWQSQRQLLQRLRDVLSLWPAADPQSARPQSSPQSLPQSPLASPLQADIHQLMVQRQVLQAEVTALTVARSRQQAQIMVPLIDQVEQLELFQQRTERLLRDVDGALQVTFRSVDQDLLAYRLGLLQRLDQMEGLSQQSETIVATLLQQLIQSVPPVPPLPPSPVTTPLPPAAVAPTPIAQLDALLGLLGLSHPTNLAAPVPPSTAEFVLTELSDLFPAGEF
jgi:hypothetical protein